MACALGLVERGVSYCICEQVRGGKKGERRGAYGCHEEPECAAECKAHYA
jgi:hypothetical protein